MSAYHESQVFAAGSARTVRLGRNYAYINTSSDDRNLEQDVQAAAQIASGAAADVGEDKA